ncbi:small subunit ribosomal protein S3 (chloroplast) [Micromonas commoda]|jgi:small subunit ribosomal protein S4|uniref:Small ribosomal subunit protein uS4c n=1 Tax=Micromonas commoda (strain RCC299 / NOUM17 / CCMP2709) TaxID=296587 RepID=C1KR69_MICCC|nr:ribosomal protein S4 [Micromonas commoda]ACO55571.1 small subunit ribosomal protein S3 [Micromonas commoda]|eukprot:YP_002808647.1 small subunit ribosomal protein S3 (chloroplast) [Micromonas commoda]
MARYRGPRVKIVRRLGELPGLTTKVPNRTYGPGQHGQATSTGKLTQFRVRLQEKQKLRYNYGISEKQLLTYVRRARRAKGPTGEVLLQMLEMRLDSIVYRLGFAPTIRAARQYVSHGLITVNGQTVNIPSYNCLPGETIASTSNPVVENCKTFGGAVPSHLTVDTAKTTGKIQRVITRSQIALTVNELLIIEFYSRKG